MKFNGNEKLKGIFGEKVEAYFSAEKYQNSDIWFIDDVDDLNLFNAWFGAQEFKISDVINNVAVVTYKDIEKSLYYKNPPRARGYSLGGAVSGGLCNFSLFILPPLP